ncbi:MAG TPA: HEAT repeat domain-containing protein [Candidatus Wallbacteria bacterium]|nr:HEAT repeat domain-containing protein [Candidatus Wallbacteria bacterium]
MMKKTVDVTKEIIDNIKKLDLECEAEQSKACLKLEKYGVRFIDTLLENYHSFNARQIMIAGKIAVNIKIDGDSKKDSKYFIPIINNLIIRLKNDDDKMQMTIWLTLLGKLGNVHTIPVIAGLLMSEDKRIRANAVEALGKIGGDKVKELLVPYLKDSSNRVKANTAIALWEFNELRSKIRKVFDDMIKDRDKWMKASAFYAFGEIKADEFVQILLNSIDDSDEDVCRNAFLALVSYAEQYGDEETGELKK